MIIVDRFEGDFAVLETDSGMVNAEKSKLADDIGEGDVIIETENGYIRDYAATQKRREEILALRNKLLRGDKK